MKLKICNKSLGLTAAQGGDGGHADGAAVVPVLGDLKEKLLVPDPRLPREVLQEIVRDLGSC